MNVDGVDARHCKGPAYPLVLSNVFSRRDDKPIYPPYACVEKTSESQAAPTAAKPRRRSASASSASRRRTIMQWDKRNLEGKVYTKGARRGRARVRAEAARRGRRSRRRDLARRHRRVAVRHDDGKRELVSRPQEPGIDVLLLGHSHAPFPDPANPKSRFANLPDVDNQRGFVHGKPAVMGNYWGKSLGVIDLALVRQRRPLADRRGGDAFGSARRQESRRHVRRAGSRYRRARRARARSDASHYVSTPIGDSDFAMTTYFADVGDVTALQPVNTAQREYVERYIAKNLPQYAGDSGAFGRGAVQGRLRRPDRLHRHRRRPARDPQRGRSLSLSEHADGGRRSTARC